MTVSIGNLRATWTNSNINYTGLGLNVNATAYDANSSIFKLSFNNEEKLKLDANGTLHITNNLVVSNISFMSVYENASNALPNISDVTFEGNLLITGNVGIGPSSSIPSDGLIVVQSPSQSYTRISSWTANTTIGSFSDFIAIANNGTHYTQLGSISGAGGFLNFNANADSTITTVGPYGLIIGTDNISRVYFSPDGNSTFTGNLILNYTQTPPANTFPGIKGQVAWDENYLYICFDTDRWKRVAISNTGW